ncbi:MAG: DMT family transporter, partial [Jatrophihabitantaceae bacterium]
PLLSTNLLFALAFAAVLAGQRPGAHEIGGAVLLSAALGVFIAVGNPHSSPAPRPNNAVIVIAVGAVVGAVLCLIAVAKGRELAGKSALLATAAGLLYGLQDVSTRATLQFVQDRGIAEILLSPWLYIVVGSAVIAILLSQSAFKAARLDYSLPPIAAAEPIAGIALGVGLLGDVVSVSVVGILVDALCLVAMVGGVALIARSHNLAGHHLRRTRTVTSDP